MATDCIDNSTCPERTPLHDAILAVAVAVIIIIPAVLGLGSLF